MLTYLNLYLSLLQCMKFVQKGGEPFKMSDVPVVHENILFMYGLGESIIFISIIRTNRFLNLPRCNTGVEQNY